MHSRFCIFALALALALTAQVRAQLAWSVYDEAAITPVTSPVAGRVAITVPAGQRATLIATNFVPIDLTATTAAAATISLNFTASGGLNTLASGTRAIGFGLFNHNGTAANFTDDSGYFTWLNGRATGNLIELRRRNGNGPSPSLLNPTGASFANLGTGAATATAGALTDGVPYTVTLRLNRSAGGISLGTGTPADAAGVRIRGDGLDQTAYSSADNPPAATLFNELAFMFLNTTAAPVTLTLDSVAGLTVISPPVITTQPQQLILNPSQPASLFVTATGTAPLTYQWRKDGVPIADATGATLTFSAATAATAGAYSVIVSNSYGSAISAPATVTVSSTPVPATIDTQPISQTVAVGQSATFSVNAFGSAPLTYEWQKNSIAIPGASTATYTIPAVTSADAGVYSVVVRNSQTSVVSNPVVLTVSSPPTIVTQPASVSVAAGAAAQLTVEAGGSGPFTYQWSKDGAPISGATTATLSIPSVSAANLGIYTVRVTNASGSVTSNAAAVSTPSTMTIATRFPAAGATAINPDTPLRLTFDRPTRVGVSGRIRIVRASDGSVVDTLDLAAASTRLIGANTTPYNFRPAIADGNSITFYPRSGTIAYNQTYYVTIETGVVLETTGAAFDGFTDQNAWRFTTRNAGPLPSASTVTVAADGTADFSTIQGAIDYVPTGNTSRVVIQVRPGIYTEMNYIGATKPFITIRGQGTSNTFITYANNANFNSGNNRAMFSVDANDFTLENITLTNSTPKGGSQAEALRGNGQRAILDRVTLLSYQDTLLWNGTLFATDSLIAGDVDFMWGNGACYFHRCELRALSSNGFYAQVRNGQGAKGNVYVGCRLTAVADVTGCYLARIDPREGVANTWPFSQVAFIDCAMGAHIAREGWKLDNATSAPNVQFWEYNSTDAAGATLDVTGRIKDSRQINDATAAQYRDPQFVVGFTPSIAPTLTLAPGDLTTNAGTPLSLSVTASGYPQPAYQWLKDGTPISGATGSALRNGNARVGDGGAYTVRITNAAGSVTSAPATVMVQPAKYAGIYFGTAGTGGVFALYVRDNGTGVFWALGLQNLAGYVTHDVRIDGNGHAQFIGITPGELTIDPSGNVSGKIDRGVAETIITTNPPHSISGTRSPASGATQDSAGYFVTGAGDRSAAVEIIVDATGRVFAGMTDGRGGMGTLDSARRFSVSGLTGTIAADGASATASATVSGTAVNFTGGNDRTAAAQRLTGLSTRAQASTGGNAVIVGFVIGGTTPKPVLIRAVGPALADFGVQGTLPAPRVELFRGQDVLAANASWSSSPNASEIARASNQVGLFPLASGSGDSALLRTLAPGAYTAVMADTAGRTGNGLVEIYDLSPDNSTQRMANLSSRAFVGTGDATLIAGMTVSGNVSKRVLIRAAGPALAGLGVSDALARPVLTLLQGSRTIATNAAWDDSDSPEKMRVFGQVGAFSFRAGSADAALLLNLPPGNYTAQVTGAGGSTGVALVEVYEL